jgi:cytochrome c-type biogenesis protein CcmF
MFPVISEAVQGQKISVGAPFFNKVNIPVGLFLLFLTGVGPLLAWRKTSLDGLRRNFLWPAVSGLVVGVVLVAFGSRDFYANTCFMLSMFVTGTIFQEFYKGARTIGRKQQMSLIPAGIELTLRNTRRYGGYIVHMGMVLIFIGLGGAAFNTDHEQEMQVGSKMEIRSYTLQVTDLRSEDNANASSQIAVVDIYKNGERIGTMKPERRFYKASKQPASIVTIRPRLLEDLYLVYKGQSEDGQSAALQAFVNPLVNWIWLGGLVNVLGTAICLIPSRKMHAAARTEFAAPAAKLREVPS